MTHDWESGVIIWADEVGWVSEAFHVDDVDESHPAFLLFLGGLKDFLALPLGGFTWWCFFSEAPSLPVTFPWKHVLQISLENHWSQSTRGIPPQGVPWCMRTRRSWSGSVAAPPGRWFWRRFFSSTIRSFPKHISGDPTSWLATNDTWTCCYKVSRFSFCCLDSEQFAGITNMWIALRQEVQMCCVARSPA